MGNEMGNNNVSGLQEEDKARTEEAQGKILEEDVPADELKGEKHMKPEAEDKDVQQVQKLNEKVVPSENPLAVEEPQVEYKTSNANEEHDIEFKPLSGPLEIPADSNDAEKDAMNHEKKNLDEILSTTAEHCTEKEMAAPRETEYTETENQIVDSKAELREVDLIADQHNVVHDEQVGEGIYTTGSENGHLVSNEIAVNMNLCVEPENGNQNMATSIVDTLVVKAIVCEEEFKGPSCGGEVEVFSPEEVDKCSSYEHDGNLPPLDTLHPLQDAPEAAEASDQQVESMEKSEAPKDNLSSPLEILRAPLEALEPEVVTIEAPLEALESPLGDSDPKSLALPLLVKASGSTLEVSNPLVEVSKSPVEDLKSPSAASEPLMEESNSILKTSDLLLEASESQLEPYTQLSSINTPQEVYEPQDNTIYANEVIQIAIETQNGETKLSYNEEVSSEENDKIIETFKSNASQSEHISAGSDCNKNENENALASTIEKDCLDTESEAHSQEPQVSFLDQTLEPCLQEQEQIKENLVLAEENKSIGCEASESTLVSTRGPLENLESPLGASDSQTLALTVLVETLDSPLEVSNSVLEVSEPQVEASKSPSKASELPLEASNSHKAAESQLEAFSLPHMINSSQEVYEAIHIASEMQIGETKLADNQTQSSEENEKKLETLKPRESQSELEVQSDKVQVAILNQINEPCLEKQQSIKESPLLAEQRKVIGSEADRKESQCDCLQTRYCDQESKESKTDNIIASQSEFVTTETDCKTNEIPSPLVCNSTYSSEENCQLEDFDVNHIEDHVSIGDKNLKQDYSEVSDMMSKIKAASLLDNDKRSYFHDSEVLKDKNELVSDSKSELIIIKENFEPNLSDAITQSMLPTPVKELEQNIQETSESSTLLFDKQNAKDQETVEKLMTESTSVNASGHVEFRKSPSFNVDHSIGLRSEDSDQTPLLCHDKTAGRSSASQDEAMQAGYNAVQDEAVLVAEKTIRMERSDSERPSAPFLSLLQKEESSKVLVKPEKQERVAADKKAKKNPWTVVHKTFALTSPRDNNGKQKSKSSIFSTCICCSTKNT